MKKIIVILVFLLTGFGADAALRTGGGTGGATTARGRTDSATTATTTSTSARAARSRSATKAPTSPVTTTSTGTRTTTTITPTESEKRTTAARAAKQSVISTGTKVTAAAQNTVVDEKCWNGFMGCMDSFCMLDNANGGRCMCSDKNAEYDSILAEIQSLDEQSYQMATFGVEQIEMGDAAKAVMDKTNSITKRIEADSQQSKRKSLDLSAWNITEVDFDADAEDIFSLSSDGTAITNKTGDALYRAAAKLCNAQLPECKSQSTMMELMYKQRVRSDCTAYENSLRQQRMQSAQKLATAQSAMREAALEQYRNANKYDLGQCTVQFKQCMQTTGGCGDDFTGCVEYSVREGMVRGDKTGKTKTIKGTSSQIKLSAETYDVLESKKELCMSVTQQCVNVRDQVWDTFLREVAPQVKSAELIVESNKRTSCISNISACFQKACKDNIDPNDPDGSYDMCLTRPETLSGACKVEITPCENSIPNIMEYVRARLASMRVDSCTREFKQCLTSEDRCGADYTQCIGLDTDTIVRMCPRDKLVGCYNSKKPDQDVYDELAEIATGVFLNIDNNMLTACQRAADAAMIKVCGSTENCDELAVDNDAGTRSFKYEVCKNKINKDNTLTELYCRDSLEGFTREEIKDTNNPLVGKLSGLVYWGNITYEEVDNTGRKDYEPTTKIVFTNETDYLNKLQEQQITLLDDDRKAIHDRVFGTEITALTTTVENAIHAIESDPTVQYCMTGRKFQGMNNQMLGGRSKTDMRFPNLTSQMRQVIANSALKNARDNYMEKYDSEMERMAKDQVKAAQIIDEEGAKATAQNTCIAYGNSGTLPTTEGPKASNAGKWVLAGTLIAAGVVLTIFAGPVGAALGLKGASLAIALGSATVASVGTGVGIGINAANNPVARGGESIDKCENTEGIGCSVSAQWNYKEKIVTIPNYETGECIKIKTTQNCTKIKKDYCKEWGEEEETQTTMNLLN